MITEDYVSFETAKLLKERGFNEKCGPYYGLDETLINGVIIEAKHNIDKNKFSAPTLQMAMKWLREKYNLHIITLPYAPFDRYSYHPDFEAEFVYIAQIFRGIIPIDEVGRSIIKLSPEKAYETAIKYCLEKLINKDKKDECEDKADEPFAVTMEQDLGQVLMNDFCARLPYGVIVLDGPAEQRGKLWSVSHDYMVSYESDVSEELERQSIFNVRCYLRSMSSITEEEREELSHYENAGQITDFYNSHHFDYRGLIEKGRALEAPEGMYKTE